LVCPEIVIPVPEFLDPRFRRTSPEGSYSVIENERFGLVFAKTGFIISGTDNVIREILKHGQEGVGFQSCLKKAQLANH
jgi:hypothetical protein